MSEMDVSENAVSLVSVRRCRSGVRKLPLETISEIPSHISEKSERSPAIFQDGHVRELNHGLFKQETTLVTLRLGVASL